MRHGQDTDIYGSYIELQVNLHEILCALYHTLSALETLDAITTLDRVSMRKWS